MLEDKSTVAWLRDLIKEDPNTILEVHHPGLESGKMQVTAQTMLDLYEKGYIADA